MIEKAPWVGPELIEYVYPNQNEIWGKPIEWRPNEPFVAELGLRDFERGRSAARFIWTNMDTGGSLPMFMVDMLDVVKTQEIQNGRVRARWIVRKRGQNYGIALAPEVTW